MGYLVPVKVSRLREGKILSVAKKQCQSYDAFGNIKGQATVASSQTCTPSSWSVDSATNRLNAPVTYDAAGNQTSWNSGVYVYWWYPTGQMRQFDSSGRVTIHGFSADGERVGTYDSSLAGITYTLRGLDGKVLRVYREASGVWTWVQDYVYRDGAHLATIDSTGTRHLHLDHLGSIRLITNSSGTQVALHTYYPFGQEATSTTQDSERMKFTGHELDLRDSSGTTDDLYYMHARHYNPNLGRFLSVDPGRDVDPKIPQAWNMYAYVRGNPMKYVDPDGSEVNPVTGRPGLSYVPVHGLFGRIRADLGAPTVGLFGQFRDGGRTFHPGIDLNAPAGTDVYASASGRVTLMGNVGKAGNRLDITLSDGTVLTFAHLESFGAGLRKGTEIVEGEIIGQVGKTGNASRLAEDKEHLHFAVTSRQGERVDPAKWLNEYAFGTYLREALRATLKKPEAEGFRLWYRTGQSTPPTTF